MAQIEDRSVYPTMVSLRDCLCLQVSKTDAPDLCQCLIVPALSDGFLDLGLDGDCEKGSGFVRLVQLFHSTEFPSPDIAGAGFLTAEFEVGVARVVTGVDEDGTAPPPETQAAEAKMIMDDMQASRRAIACCFGERDDPQRDYALGLYTPLPGVGGLGGGSWRVFVRVE